MRVSPRRSVTVLALGATLLSGCASDMFDFMMGVPTAPAGGRISLIDFESMMMPMDNPAEHVTDAFRPGSWVTAGGVLKQVEGATDNKASHVRYVGDAFGRPNGEAGLHYKMQVDVAAYQAVDSPQVHGYPTGILAVMPYYKDPTHYVLLVANKNVAECWVVDGYKPAGEVWPGEAKVWSEWQATPFDVGVPVRWGAEVDVNAHSIKIFLNDQLKAERTIPMINRDKHWVGLAANGNYVQFDNLQLTWLK